MSSSWRAGRQWGLLELSSLSLSSAESCSSPVSIFVALLCYDRGRIYSLINVHRLRQPPLGEGERCERRREGGARAALAHTRDVAVRPFRFRGCSRTSPPGSEMAAATAGGPGAATALWSEVNRCGQNGDFARALKSVNKSEWARPAAASCARAVLGRWARGAGLPWGWEGSRAALLCQQRHVVSWRPR